MFIAHGKQINPDIIKLWIDLIYETYKYETAETILLFLTKASRGDFGKFYGDPDIGTLREWFADFLQNTIVPERERQRQANEGPDRSDRGQSRSLREYLQGSNKTGPVKLPDKLKGLS